MPPHGILLIDKPGGLTSHDVVARVRRVAGTRRVGHAGTLDPMATGLLVVCVGPATRVVQCLVGLEKVYVGTIELGAVSSTYDAEGEIAPQDRPIPDDIEAIRAAMAEQLGEHPQTVPSYSAVKVRGRKLYEYARAGEAVPVKSRTVRIARFDLLRWSPPAVEFEARVGSGTYLRAMAHDLGATLGCGAYLSRLRRTRVGGFEVAHAVPLDALLAEPDLLTSRLMRIEEALGHLPKVVLHPRIEEAARHGRPFTTRDVLEMEGLPTAGQTVLVLDAHGEALSISRCAPHEDDEISFVPTRVLAASP